MSCHAVPVFAVRHVHAEDCVYKSRQGHFFMRIYFTFCHLFSNQYVLVATVSVSNRFEIKYSRFNIFPIFVLTAKNAQKFKTSEPIGFQENIYVTVSLLLTQHTQVIPSITI